MKAPGKPANEESRIRELESLNILDTLPEERFDRLTRLAKRLFGVPIALVSLVDADRQWFKSRQGLDVEETSREVSFCGHAILGDDLFVVDDAETDERFADNPLVLNDPGIRFYAGCPIRTPEGSKIGTICLIDRQPRELDSEDMGLLYDLGRLAEQEFEAMRLATMDDLTMLSNRRGFQALAHHALSLCRRLERPASVFFFDLDDFKEINDEHGHAEGDRALSTFGSLLKKVFRDSDVIGRLGGDEFAVLLTSTSQDECERALDRFREAVDEENGTSGRPYELRYSVGMSSFDPDDHESIGDLLHAADERMYAAKKSNRT